MGYVNKQQASIAAGAGHNVPLRLRTQFFSITVQSPPGFEVLAATHESILIDRIPDRVALLARLTAELP